MSTEQHAPARPWAFAVIDNLGRLSVYLDQARADEVAAQRHGSVVPLAPLAQPAQQTGPRWL